MAGQIVHIDLIEGAAWLPWMLVAVHALTTRDRPTGRRRPGAVGGGPPGVGWSCWPGPSGCPCSAGAAEAIIDSGVLVGIYLVGRLVTMGYLRRGDRRALARSSGPSRRGGRGLALGAAQWLSGLDVPVPVPAGADHLLLLRQRLPAGG